MQPVYQRYPIMDMPKLYGEISRDLTFVQHMHRHMELIILLDGSVAATIGGQTRRLNVGDVAFVDGNRPHAYQTYGHSRCLLVIWEGSLLPDYGQKLSGNMVTTPFMTLPITANERDTIVEGICQTCNEEVRKGYLRVLLGYAFAELSLAARPENRDLLERALNYLDGCYREQFSLEQMARAMFISKCALSRTFNEQVGCGLTQYVNAMRVSDACVSLAATDDPIGKIALDCGFGSLRSFNRAFLRAIGVSPRAYRQESGQVVTND